jgi:hypothetical protein
MQNFPADDNALPPPAPASRDDPSALIAQQLRMPGRVQQPIVAAKNHGEKHRIRNQARHNFGNSIRETLKQQMIHRGPKQRPTIHIPHALANQH